jgi:hypothetical protein
MSRIRTPTLDTATGATAEIYPGSRKAAGKAPNSLAAILEAILGVGDPAEKRAA